MGSFFLMLLSKRLLLKLQELCQELHLNPCPFMCFTCMLLKMYTLSGSGKTLYEILTVAGAMLLPMAGPRVDCNLSRHGSVRPSLQRAVTAPEADCCGAVSVPLLCRPVLAQKSCYPSML